MKEPIMSLKLNPRRRQQIQRRGWDEIFPRHEALAQHPWVRIPQLILGRLWRQRPGKIAPKSHARASHPRHFCRIEFPVRVSCILEPLVDQGSVI